MSLGFSPLCFLWQRNRSIKIHNNAYDDGYVILRFFQKDYEEDAEEVVMTADEIIITGFEHSGIYYFQVKDEYGNSSFLHTVYILSEDMHSLFKKIAQYIGKKRINPFIEEKLEYIEEHANAYADHLLYHVIDAMNEIEDIQQHEKFYMQSIMQIVEQQENVQSIVLNEMIHDVAFEYGTVCSIRTNDLVTHIDIVRKDEHGVHFDARIDTEDNPARYPLLFTEDALYYIYLYHGEELLGSFIHYQFDEHTLSMLWKTQQSEINTIIDTINEDLLLSQDDFEFTSKEKKLLIEEQQQEKKNWIVPRVAAEKGATFGDVRIYIDQYENLVAQGTPFYIVAKESDCFSDSLFNRSQLITDNVLIFNTYKHNLSNECTFYIKDDKDKIVSKYTRYSHDYDYSEYEWKKHHLEIMAYGKQLIRYVNSLTKLSNIHVLLSSTLEKAMQMEHATLENTLMLIIDTIIKSEPLGIPKNNLIYIILENWFKQFDYASEYLPRNKVAYFHADNRLVVPACKNEGYVRHYVFSTHGSVKSHVYPITSTDNTTIYLKEPSSLHVLYIVDHETYGRSGFICINTMPEDRCQLSNTLTIEVDPDDR